MYTTGTTLGALNTIFQSLGDCSRTWSWGQLSQGSLQVGEALGSGQSFTYKWHVMWIGLFLYWLSGEIAFGLVLCCLNALD